MTPDMVLPQPASISRSRPTKRSKNGQHDSSPPPPQLAEDVLVEIFAQLPAKSVGRCRCLSRSWADTLSSASFTDLHLEQANDSQRKQEHAAGAPPKLFFTTAPSRLHAWHHAPPPVLRELTGDVLRVLPQQPDRGSYSQVVVSKPCHGLVLLLRWPCHGHYVCNPCTGALLPLPDTKTPSRMCGRDDLPGTRANSVSYGLGYDPATKEHKVVRLFYLREEGDPAVTACEVFSIGRPSTSVHWRSAAQRPPPCTTLRPWMRAAAVFFSGRLHFLQHGGEYSIVTFDVCNETFGSLTPPPGLDHVTFDLAVLDGCLCLHYGHYSYRRGDGGHYIWRLRSSDGPGAGQWEQLYYIQQQTWPQDLLNLDLDQISPLEIYHDRNGHKKIMFATTVLTVFTVDVHLRGGGAPEILLLPPTDSFTKHRSLYTNAVGLLHESLVSVGHPSEEIIFSSPPMKAWSDVLKWLPTRTVVPLMRVCQAWRAMIKSNRFIQLHATLHANMGKMPPRLTLIAASHGIFWPLEEGRDREIQQYDMLKFLFTGCESRVVCSKPCHGLVVGSCTNGLKMSWDFICNPTMGYYKQVDLDPDGDASFLDGRIGLGYDSRVNKHVLVRLVYRERDLNSWDYHLGCYVRHMDTEMWRAIKPPPRPVAEMQSVHVDGKLYWMVDPDIWTESSSGWEMLVLDITTEEFTVLEGPECYYDQVKSIVELQGNICVVCSDDIRNAMDIWMLEGGVWSIWCRIELEELSAEYSEETVVLEVDPTDGRLLLNTGKVIGYYDPMTRTIETIHRLVGRMRALKFAPVLCQESLISPYIRVETAMLL